MSLDIALRITKTNPKGSGIFVRRNGKTIEISRSEWDEMFPGLTPVVMSVQDDTNVWNGNITHNLSEMATEAGIYSVVWHPYDVGVEYAGDIIATLEIGIDLLKSDPERFKKFDDPDSWGTYDDFVPFLEGYLKACRMFPTAKIWAWS